MFRFVQCRPPYPYPSYEVDPNAEFEPGMIKQLSVIGGKVVEAKEQEKPSEEPKEK
jgi:hypothetical protein